ncbi:MAG TPA: hypothetical protein VIT91_08210 [Chthoniobacterales bacterium]
MKNILAFAVAVVLSACSTYRAYEYPPTYAFSSTDELFELSVPNAKKRARTLATSDYKKGIYRTLFFGYPTGEGPEERLLRKKYAVYSIPIGCVVSDSVIAFTETYNDTMKPLLVSHFNTDIFAR